MTTLVVHSADKPLIGSVPVPTDTRIGHRALALAALASGESRLTGAFTVDGLRATVACLGQLGVEITASANETVVSGVGLAGLRAPRQALDCRTSDATMRLLGGLLAAAPFRTSVLVPVALDGISRPMTDVARALRQRGAILDGAVVDSSASGPMSIGPLLSNQRLSGIEYESSAADEDVKTALLVSGLYAEGATRFKEPTVSPDHTERLFQALGIPLRTLGTIVQLDPSGWKAEIPGFAFAVPGDLSAASFVLVAANLVEGSRVTTRGVGVNPTRTGLLEIARDMGGGLTIEPQGERHGEPVAELHAWNAPLRAATVGGETASRAKDDLPLACALAARATGVSRVALSETGLASSLSPSRHAAIVRMLRAFGVACDERLEGLEIEGRLEPLEGATVDSGGDASIAMTAAVLGLVARGTTRIVDAACIAGTYPKFVATLRALGARVDVEA